MATDLSAFVRALREATSFEDAAACVLRAMLSVCEKTDFRLEADARPRVLRGMVHLRPSGGYRGLVIVGLRDGRAEGMEARTEGPSVVDDALLPSASAWRWVETGRAAVAIDVHLGLVETTAAEAKGSEVLPRARSSSGFGTQDSRLRLLGRDTTHVLALPLWARIGVVDGMVSIECACQAGIGQPRFWREVSAELSLLADVAAPHLCSSPLRATAEEKGDPLLPVVGRATAGLVRLLRVFARQDETILISGPTGSGKSRLARFCHATSPRASGPFEAMDLLGVPESMQMGELFGWKRGAFSGAVSDYAGCVARAEGGTLFIDEVDKLSFTAQAGLLKLLEEKRFHVLGDSAGERRANVRFLVGTNAELLSAVKEGRFREDLYYRIHVLPIRLPPLAERVDEIPGWAAHMVSRRASETGAEGEARLTAEAVLALCEHPFPGNLRQLDNVVRRAFAIALVDLEEGSGALSIDERHVRQALGYEAGARRESLLELLRRAASAFVTEAARSGGKVELDHTEALRGLVLHEAMALSANRDDAFRLLGKAALLKNRNHHKALKRAMEKVVLLARALGEEPDAEIAALASSAEDDA